MQKQKEENTKQISSIGYVLCCVLIGALFLLFPGWVIGTLSLILGLLCIAYGTWKLITALRTAGFTRIGALLGGAAAILIGGYIIRQPENVFSLLPFAAGIFFLLDGIDRIRCAAAMHRTVRNTAANKRQAAAVGKQKRRFYTACIIGVVTVICGIILLLYPFDALEFTLRIVGFLILCNGVGAFWTAHALRVTVRLFGTDASKRPPDGKYEADFRDITETTEEVHQ